MDGHTVFVDETRAEWERRAPPHFFVADKYAVAMNELADTDGLIIDRRDNGGGGPGLHGRPASLQRCERMQALLGELANGEMDSVAIAAFLRCSNSSARKYVMALVDADLVFPSTLPSGQGRPKLGYCLTEDLQAVDDFMSGLLAGQNSRAALKRTPKRSGQVRTVGSQHFHIMADDQSGEVQAAFVSVRRDPLVAALFGSHVRY
jgi:hypothetical protein